jgi:hypothetical protein
MVDTKGTSDGTRVLQFMIELLGVDPPIWRRIQVPENYSFWDLHVAIQDAMGWRDYHLHAFRVVGSEDVIGIPDKEGDDPLETKPGWKLRIFDYFNAQCPLAVYEYDFGSSWVHAIRFEGLQDAEAGGTYPKCLDGARHRPPEDCGGVQGYEDLLKTLSDPSDPEHASKLEWVGGSFDSEHFDATAIQFDNPVERWRKAVGGSEQ